eukprot:3304830-Rhodomonas_salina.3
MSAPYSVLSVMSGAYCGVGGASPDVAYGGLVIALTWCMELPKHAVLTCCTERRGTTTHRRYVLSKHSLEAEHAAYDRFAIGLRASYARCLVLT